MELGQKDVSGQHALNHVGAVEAVHAICSEDSSLILLDIKLGLKRVFVLGQ